MQDDTDNVLQTDGFGVNVNKMKVGDEFQFYIFYKYGIVFYS
jgi:hypothetical protein